MYVELKLIVFNDPKKENTNVKHFTYQIIIVKKQVDKNTHNKIKI